MRFEDLDAEIVRCIRVADILDEVADQMPSALVLHYSTGTSRSILALGRQFGSLEVMGSMPSLRNWPPAS